MILLPAVDILGGKAVRLTQGSFDAPTVYDEDPLRAAVRWAQEGALTLHVVDLDGARAGEPMNLEHVEKIVRHAGVPVQVGGGLRTIDAVERVVGVGAARVVLGTAAFSDPQLLDQAIERFGDRVVVSVDARDGRLATSGWLEQTDLRLEAVIERLGDRGVRHFVYSSIDRDGTLGGPDLDGLRRAGQAGRGRFIYSGGVASLDDLRALTRSRGTNLTGVIVGKALYEGRFTIREGQAALNPGGGR